MSGRPLDLDSEISSIAPLSSMMGSVHTLLSIPVYRNLLAGVCGVGWGGCVGCVGVGVGVGVGD